MIRFTSVRGDGFIGEINKPRQSAGVDEYVCKFKELKSLMATHNRRLDEHYFISSFLSGLKSKVKYMMEMLSPNSLDQAIMMTRKQEVLLEAVNRGKPATRPSSLPVKTSIVL